MTFNHFLRRNLFILLASIMISCAVPKSNQNVKNHIASKPNEEITKVDTIKISKAEPVEFLPITTNSKSGSAGNNQPQENNTNTIKTSFKSQKKDIYNIAVLLPLYSGRQLESSSINDNVLNIIQFYSGMKMAIEQLNREGPKLNIQVFDIANGDTIKSLLNNHLKKIDLIIGPYKSENLITTADYALKNQIMVLSPWGSPSNLQNTKQNVIYCKPGVKAYSEKILEIIRKNGGNAKVVGICKTSDAKQQNAWQNIKSQMINAQIDVSEKIFPDSITKQDVVGLSAILDNQKMNYIFIPYTNEENTINELIRKVNACSGSKNVTIFGFGEWINLPKITPDLVMGSPLVFLTQKFNDMSDEKCIAFQKHYYEKYGLLAETEAYFGHDLMLWAGRMLGKYGTVWLETGIPQGVPGDGYFNPFNFRKNTLMGPKTLDDVEYFQNMSLEAFRYSDYKFIRYD